MKSIIIVDMNKQRCKKIIDELAEHEYISGKSLSKRLEVSTRTVRSDIDSIRTFFDDQKVEIVSNNKLGYHLIVKDEEYFNEECKRISDYSCLDSQQDRIRYIFEILITNSNGYYSFNKLVDRLYVSKSTLYNDLKELNKLLEDYNLTLESKSGSYRIVGKEFDIRMCFTNCIIGKFTNNDNQTKETIKEISYCIETNLQKHNIHINQVAYNNLVFHIYIALNRSKNGYFISEDILKDKDIHETIEYKCAQSIIKDLQKTFSIEIPESENYYVAIHLASKKVIDRVINSNNLVISPKIYQTVNEMLNRINDEYGVNLSHDLDLRMVLAAHLVPMTVRLSYNIGMINPLIKEIKNRFPLAYMMACSACSILGKEYQKEISEDEIGFIALHINLAIERSQLLVKKKNVVIVCSTGKGSAELLSYKVKQQFGKEINKVLLIDVMQLKSLDISEYDCIFTTVPIPFKVNKPILEIQLFLNDVDVENVKKILSDDDSNDSFILSENMFVPELKVKNKEDCIKQMIKHISKYKEMPNDLYESIIEREKMGYTSFGNSIALPHAMISSISDNCLCVAILDKPVLWDEKEVQIVIMFVLSKNNNRKLDSLIKSLSKIVFDQKIINELIEKRDYTLIKNILTDQA